MHRQETTLFVYSEKELLRHLLQAVDFALTPEKVYNVHRKDHDVEEKKNDSRIFAPMVSKSEWRKESKMAFSNLKTSTVCSL